MLMLISLSLAGFTLAQGKPGSLLHSAVAMQQNVSGSESIPAFHQNAPRRPLPATMDPKSFPDSLNQNVYAMAGKVKNVLYQQPC